VIINYFNKRKARKGKLSLVLVFFMLFSWLMLPNDKVYAITSTINPTVDTFFDTLEPTNNWGSGDNSNLPPRVVNWVGNSPGIFENCKAQLKFDLSSISGTVASAELKLYVPYLDGTDGNPQPNLYGSNFDSWDETANTINTQDTYITQTNVNGIEQWITFDVTNFINSQVSGDKTATLVLTGASSGTSIFAFCSDEDSVYKPKLEVTMAANSAPT